jgi:hypothetical protein
MAQMPRPLPPKRADAVIEFLARVAADPRLRAEYFNNADAAMTRGGLTAAERELILNGPLARIEQALGHDKTKGIQWQPKTVWA